MRPYTYYNGEGGVRNVYCSEGSQRVAARPSGKGRLLARKTLGSKQGKVMANGLLGVFGRGWKLGI